MKWYKLWYYHRAWGDYFFRFGWMRNVYDWFVKIGIEKGDLTA